MRKMVVMLLMMVTDSLIVFDRCIEDVKLTHTYKMIVTYKDLRVSLIVHNYTIHKSRCL